MDAIKLLIQDHHDAARAMDAIDSASGPAKRALFSALVLALKVHDRVEENILFPAVRPHLETAGYSPADREAHRDFEKSIQRLKALPVDDPHWSASFDLMRLHLQRHTSDEESHLFLAIRSFLDDSKLEELGRRMKLEKERLMTPV